MKRLIAAIAFALSIAAAPSAMAVDETVGYVEDKIWVNKTNITFFLDVVGPCGSVGFVLENSNPIFWQIYLGIMTSRSEGTRVDVVSGQCYSGNGNFTLVEWIAFGV